jgi:hypothetical protein
MAHSLLPLTGFIGAVWWDVTRTRLEDPLATERAEPESGPRPDAGWPRIFACFAEDLTPSDERLLRTMLAELLQSP